MKLNNLKFYSVALLEEFSVILWNFHLESNFERETSGGQILRPPGGRPRVLPDPEILPFEQQKSLCSARKTYVLKPGQVCPLPNRTAHN